ncbi:hypothetical protein AHF37_11234 [Paragonimus kellicotti]|nr:hypothetical protein AHF37_11234 [Paragonimus kellicotti]
MLLSPIIIIMIASPEPQSVFSLSDVCFVKVSVDFVHLCFLHFQFGWTHVTLLIVVCTSHFQIYNIFNGIIWFLLPVSLTPLIKLSPKKTWEGFIGGGLATLVFGLLFSAVLVQFDYFVCPLEWDDVIGALTTSCTRNPVFMPKTYNVSKWLFMIPFRQFTWYPFLWHSLVIALYTSVVGPFGGFFASGFKRAFRIKDFGDLFPRSRGRCGSVRLSVHCRHVRVYVLQVVCTHLQSGFVAVTCLRPACPRTTKFLSLANRGTIPTKPVTSNTE